MKRNAMVVFLCLILSGGVWGQPVNAETFVNTAYSHTASTDTAPKLLFDVLFATNEDCDLLINDDMKTSVSKDEFRYLKLAAGIYRYKAKSKATGDELTESFTVLERGTNEVFIDMLYVQDVNAEERTKLRNAAFTQTDTFSSANKPTTAAAKAQLTSKEAQMETINALFSNMTLIKSGRFVMGNNRAPAPDESEHPVTLKAFYFSRFEVTQHQWEVIMGYNPSIHKGCPTCPVETVSWEEVMRFIRKINSLSDKKFRLPTEAEWEYTARLGGKAEVDKAGGQEEYIKKAAWYFSNSNGQTNPVGKKQANVSGIYDLPGNVSEWCSDWYSAAYYKEEFNQKAPEGPPLGKEKVIRGGNFKDYVGDRFRPSFRSKRPPTSKSSELGFRLVMDAEE